MDSQNNTPVKVTSQNIKLFIQRNAFENVKNTDVGHFVPVLTHQGQVYMCHLNSVIIVSDNGLSPRRRQTITWTNNNSLSMGPSGANIREIWIKVWSLSLKNLILKYLQNGGLFCLGLIVLICNNDSRHVTFISHRFRFFKLDPKLDKLKAKALLRHFQWMCLKISCGNYCLWSNTRLKWQFSRWVELFSNKG